MDEMPVGGAGPRGEGSAAGERVLRLALVLAALALLGAGLFLAVEGYLGDLRDRFHRGVLLLAVGLLVLGVHALRIRALRLFVVVATLLLQLGLGVALERVRAGPRGAEPAEVPPVFSYEQARADPEGFARWWKRARERDPKELGLLQKDPQERHAFVLIPGARVRRFESEIRINSLGFRGAEFPLDGDGRYRILALGESTTFGLTRKADDRPWPEVLEDRIAEELDCERPVQVINGGVPGWAVWDSVARLEAEIDALDPDLILTYHGFNGFPLLVRELPPVLAESPELPERPSVVLERVETAIRLWAFRRRYTAAREVREDFAAQGLMSTRYAKLYRKIAERTRDHGSRLALCTFNLAVNTDSPPDVIAFYDRVFPAVWAQIAANRLHDRLVREVARETGAVSIDTSPGLDGSYRDAFVDLVHFTQVGRDRLAENILEGLHGVLTSDPRTGCRPAGAADGRVP